MTPAVYPTATHRNHGSLICAQCRRRRTPARLLAPMSAVMTADGAGSPPPVSARRHDRASRWMTRSGPGSFAVESADLTALVHPSVPVKPVHAGRGVGVRAASMNPASKMSEVIDGAEEAVVELERACAWLNNANAGDELDDRDDLERLVVLLQRVDVARASVAWSENWV